MARVVDAKARLFRPNNYEFFYSNITCLPCINFNNASENSSLLYFMLHRVALEAVQIGGNNPLLQLIKLFQIQK